MKKQLKFLFLIAVIFLLSLTIISCDLLKEITAEQYTKEETEKGKETTSDTGSNTKDSENQEVTINPVDEPEDDYEYNDALAMSQDYKDRYGYKFISSNSKMKSLYEKFYTKCLDFSGSNKNVYKTNDKYLLAEIELPLGISQEEVSKTFTVFTADNPEFYWLSSTYITSSQLGKLSDVSLFVDDEYVSADTRKQINNAINALTHRISTNIASLSTDFEKAFYIHNYIVNHMNYAYKADGTTPEDASWAHNLVGCSAYRLGVCESYAETFYYVCMCNNIDCLIVTGKGKGENHAWNLVKIDGTWYGVDCTWDEMKDSESVACESFGMSRSKLSEFHKEYKSTGSSDEYLYDLPEMSNQSLTVLVLNDEGKETLCYSFENAFSKMKENGKYSVTIAPESFKGIKIYCNDYVLSSTDNLPNIEELTLKGPYKSDGGRSFTPNRLTIYGNITYDTKLTIENLFLSGDALTVSDLVLDGEYVNIYSNLNATTLEINTNIVLSGIGSYLNVMNAKTSVDNLNISMNKASRFEAKRINNTKNILFVMSFESKSEYPSVSIGNAVGEKIIFYIDGAVTSGVKATKDNFDITIGIWKDLGYDLNCVVLYIDSSGNQVQCVRDVDYYKNSSGEIKFK